MASSKDSPKLKRDSRVLGPPITLAYLISHNHLTDPFERPAYMSTLFRNTKFLYSLDTASMRQLALVYSHLEFTSLETQAFSALAYIFYFCECREGLSLRLGVQYCSNNRSQKSIPVVRFIFYKDKS